jgi:pre-mRNA-splicing helicase BRR2
MCHAPKKDNILKFLSEPLPIESTLAQNLHDHLSAEVCSGTIESI